MPWSRPCSITCRGRPSGDVGTRSAVPEPAIDAGAISPARLTHGLRQAVGARPASLLHLSLSWNAAFWPFHHPLDYIGSAGGGGIGAGPGIAVGAALALRGSGRLPVAVCGDGDFLMGATAIWTAVHYNIPLLVVVANNRSFFNDELHQERVARMRNRPVENRWIGQRIADPEIDISRLGPGTGRARLRPDHRRRRSGGDVPQRDRGGGRRRRRRGGCAGGARLRAGRRRGVVPHVTFCWFAQFRDPAAPQSRASQANWHGSPISWPPRRACGRR